MTTLCRLCIADSEIGTDLSEIREGLPLSTIAMIICPIKIEHSDFLPKKICGLCLEIILSAYKLRETSNNSERYLKAYNDENQETKIDEIHQIEYDQVDDVKQADMTSSIVESEEEEDEGSLIEQEDIIEEDQISKDDYVMYESIEEDCVIEEEISVCNSTYRVDCQSIQTKKSAVWNFIGHLTDDKGKLIEADKDSYFCKICVEQSNSLKPKYKVESTATSVLFAHLHKAHGISKADMIENSSFSNVHQVPELVTCEVCTKPVNGGSLNIHISIEHANGAFSREYDNRSDYKVNCFKKTSKSLAWDYFGALENLEGEQQDDYYFYCRLCVEEENKLSPKYTKNTSTSILLQHLNNAHIPKAPEQLAKRKLPEPILSSVKRVKLDELVCRICNEQLDSRRSFNRHMAKEHDEEQPRVYTCPIEDCEKSFTMRDTLSKHIRNIHESATKYPCDRCPAVLSARMSLKRHIDSCHLKLKSYVCDQCDATYTEQKTLKNHIQKVHLGVVEKKVQCDSCELLLPNQWSLRRHMMTHTKEVRTRF